MRIEMSAECGGLPMISFLILPMQRVTRLPLLMDVSEAPSLYLPPPSSAPYSPVSSPATPIRLIC